MSANILIVDDEEDIRNLIKGILEDEGYTTTLASGAAQTYQAMKEKTPDLVVLDIWLQGSEHDGLEILAKIMEDDPLIPVVMISGHGTIETAVSAIKLGAYDFIEKPFKADRLLLMIKRALETTSLKRENIVLRQKADTNVDFIGTSQATKELVESLEKVAATNSRVLLTGAPGTGKDIAARFIHQHSDRAGGPYLALNCATLRPERLEVELFGCEGGVMGEPAKTGLLEQAHGGTLLLDEVSDMPLETQNKIVRVLQEQNFQKVGSSKYISVDVRIIASTNRDLEKLVEEGRFRQDLFYRLNVVPVTLPALSQRSEDIAALASYFINVISEQSGLPQAQFSEKALELMRSYPWPGNIRQLRNVVEWVMIMNGPMNEHSYGPEHLPPEINTATVPKEKGATLCLDFMALPLRDAREMFEREYLLSQVNRFGGNISKTAQFVGMERSAFHRKLKSLQVDLDNKDTKTGIRKRA